MKPVLTMKPVTTMKSLDRIIKDLRLERFYSLSFVSRSLNLSVAKYKAFESGAIIPIPHDTLLAIRKFYSYPVELLIDFTKVKDNIVSAGLKLDYYIQHGNIGESMLWYKTGGDGFTTELNLAERFSISETKVIIKQKNDSAWLCSHIDCNAKALKTTVNMNFLDADFQFLEPLNL